MLDVPHTINLYPITKFIIYANPFLEAIPVVTPWSRNMKYGLFYMDMSLLYGLMNWRNDPRIIEVAIGQFRLLLRT